MSIICTKCNGTKHIRTADGWTRCDCLYQEIFNSKVDSIGVDKEVADQILEKKAEYFPKNRLTFVKCQERLEAGQIPKKPLLFLEKVEDLKKIELFFNVVCKDVLSYSMFDVIDAFFNDPPRFRRCVSSRVNIFYMGSEVQNEAVAKVLTALFLPAARSGKLIVLFGANANYKSFLSSYPASMNTVMRQFNLKVVQ